MAELTFSAPSIFPHLDALDKIGLPKRQPSPCRSILKLITAQNFVKQEALQNVEKRKIHCIGHMCIGSTYVDRDGCLGLVA